MNTDTRKLTGNDTRIRWTGNVRPARKTGQVMRILQAVAAAKFVYAYGKLRTP